MIKYSFIIPAYNSEKTIGITIDSILSNDNDNYEIIVINDGSTDDTLSILKHYKNNIKLIDIDNGGVSHARNVGLKNAIGKYILFVDSDDIVSPNLINSIDKLVDDNIDLIQYCFIPFIDFPFFDNNKEYNENISMNKTLINDETCKIIYNYRKEKRFINGNIWTKVFKKDLIINNKIMFNEELHMFEDGIFILDYLKTCNNIICISDVLYLYRRDNQNSLTTKYDNNILYQNEISINYLKNTYKDRKFEERTNYFVFTSIITYFKMNLFHKNNTMSKNEKYNNYLKIIDLYNIKKKISFSKINNNRHLFMYIVLFYMPKKIGYCITSLYYKMIINNRK